MQSKVYSMKLMLSSVFTGNISPKTSWRV